MQISRIRLSDKTSCFRPRKVACANDDGKTAECEPRSICHDTYHNYPATRSRPAVSSKKKQSSSSSFASTWYAFHASWRLTEFRRVAPISTPSSLHASTLNQGSFPPSALPDFVSTTSLSATLSRPACPSRASSWSFARPRNRVSRVARAFPCVHAVATTPAQRLWMSFTRLHIRVSLPRIGCRVGLRIVLFEDCSAFTRVTACTLAKSPICDPLHQRLQPLRYLHDCSDCFRLERSCRVGFAPTGKAPPFHGAPRIQSFVTGKFRHIAEIRQLQ
jgi:hypothetical protein